MTLKPQKISDARLIELHTDNLTDKKIAEKVGANQSTVSRRREKLSLDRNYPFSELSLKGKIVRALFDNPMTSDKLQTSVNARSPLGERHKKDELYRKLLQLKEDGVVYRHFINRNSNMNGKKGWLNSKWFLNSDFVVENRLG